MIKLPWSTPTLVETDKTRVEIFSFKPGSFREEVLNKWKKDSAWAHRMQARQQRGLKAANEPKQTKIQKETTIILKIANNLKRQGKRVTAKRVAKEWPKGFELPPDYTLRRRLKRIMNTR